MRILKNNIQALSIIEVMVVLLILITGIVGTYNVLGSAKKLEVGTKNKLQAMSIAREGIEAMINIRDTNKINFSSDLPNCWNVMNYNSDCVGDNSPDYDIPESSFIIYQQNDEFEDDETTKKPNFTRWLLSKYPGIETSYNESDYRDFFQVYKDSNGLYTQVDNTQGDNTQESFKPLFTREIKISYSDNGDIDDDGNTTDDTNDPIMNITSLVQWSDSSSKSPRKVELKTSLTNWER